MMDTFVENFWFFMQVGATTVSSSEALKAGLRGKALRITHYYHDSLWQVSNKINSGSV